MKVCNKIQAGMIIGKWEIKNESIRTTQGHKKWLCHCTCGTERYVLERSLIYGGSKSCGCAAKTKRIERISHKLENQIFGELTVLHRAPKRKNGGIWWTCQCSCGELYDVPGSLLATGRRTHCNGPLHERNYSFSDISGKRFGNLTAIAITNKKSGKGNKVWKCRCDCGNEIDISYNRLLYTTQISCGCKKQEHSKKLSSFLTHIDGTILEHCKSRKIPCDNTSGVRGVYFVRGKWMAKIVFQGKQYHLGTFDTIEDASQARKTAEEIIFRGTVLL